VYEIPDAQRATLPYSSICYVQCVWPDGFLTRASAVVVGPNDVLTADHVIYDADHGGYALNITISAGADTFPTFNAPLGSYSDVAVIFARTANWDTDGDGLLTSAESQSDLALLGLRTPIANVSGSTAVAPYAGDVTGTIDGYPARGTGLMEDAVTAHASPYWSVYSVDASLGPGASGSPLLQTVNGVTSVVGVLSSGDSALTYSTYAGLFGSNWQWLQDAMRADDGVMTGAQVPTSSAFTAAATGVVTYLATGVGDVFYSTSLDETYLGRGAGDSAVFAGARSDYRLSHSGSDVLVDDTITGRDGDDTLTGMARAVFSDLSVSLNIGFDSRSIPASDLKLLEDLYVAFFNRIPEADGLDYWIGQVRAGHGIVQVADNFYAAALQYPAQTGYSDSMTSADFVNLVYRNTLGRPDGADPDGLQFWIAAITGGQSRGWVVDQIVQTALSFKGDATWGWVADLLDNKAAVANRFAVEMGLSYDSPQDSITHGIEMARAVTPTSTAEAIALIGVPDTFSTLG
jgi:V8-like Glu-specific endopeptidase